MKHFDKLPLSAIPLEEIPVHIYVVNNLGRIGKVMGVSRMDETVTLVWDALSDKPLEAFERTHSLLDNVFVHHRHSGVVLSSVPVDDIYVGMPITSINGIAGQVKKVVATRNQKNLEHDADLEVALDNGEIIYASKDMFESFTVQ